MRSVHKEFFLAPSHEEFKTRNLWSLENGFTGVFKKLKPVAQFEAAARLGKFLSAYNWRGLSVPCRQQSNLSVIVVFFYRLFICSNKISIAFRICSTSDFVAGRSSSGVIGS